MASIAACGGDDAQNAAIDAGAGGGRETPSDAGDASLGSGDAREDRPPRPTEASLDGLQSGDAANAPADATVDSEVAPGKALCVRLNDLQHPTHLTQLTVSVTQEYLGRVAADCSVAKLIPSIDEFPIFANDVLAFNVALWGCPGSSPPTDFGLIPDGIADLTSSDLARLIQHYVDGSTLVLELTPAEAAQMQLDVMRLSVDVPAVESPEFSLSRCGEDGGAADAGSSESSLRDTPIDSDDLDATKELDEPMTGDASDALFAPTEEGD
jgi:hypothetical protein